MPRDWDQHYSHPDHLDFTPAALLVETVDLVAPGIALDLACGVGRNALYLAALGWQVTAVDSSPVAIRLLRERSAGLPIDARVASLESGEFQILPDSYHLICDFFYLQRDLFPRIRAGVLPGGVFVGAIHLPGSEAARPGAFQLAPGELRSLFPGWKILYYSEGSRASRSGRPSARIIARKA